ncbi:hypothetical protein FS749_011711 [Ceratobasidium sp. UAMH 11750]|nr:hypothetical protein FS749_011711 [Ceratobasidium sp. UAMH 11750]
MTNGGTLPAVPGPQDIRPTVYAGNGPFNPMHGGNSNIAPPPPLTGGAAGAIGPTPGQSRPPQPDWRGPDGLPGPVRELPALAVSAPNGHLESVSPEESEWLKHNIERRAREETERAAGACRLEDHEEAAKLRAAQAEELAEAARLERPALPPFPTQNRPSRSFRIPRRQRRPRPRTRPSSRCSCASMQIPFPSARDRPRKSKSRPISTATGDTPTSATEVAPCVGQQCRASGSAVACTHEEEHSLDPPAGPSPPAPLPAGFRTYGPLNPMHGGNSDISPPPPLTDGAAGAIGPAPGQSHPPRPDSLAPDGLPGPVRGFPPPPLARPTAVQDPLHSAHLRQSNSTSALAVGRVTSSRRWTEQ